MANTILGDGDDNELTGSAKADRIFGRGGDDDIDGGGGGDTIAAGDGDDLSILGGKAADLFVFLSGDGQDVIRDFSIKQGDRLDFGFSGFGIEDLQDVDAGGDIQDADGDGYYLRETSSNGKPELQIFFGDDENGFDQLTLLGVSIEQLTKDVAKHPGRYDFYSGPAAKTVLGDGDDNQLEGTGKAERILGRGGDDDIAGGKGNDTILAGDGDDLSVRGGKGADTFVFASGDGQDQVGDFAIKQGDRLDLSLSGFGKEDLKDVDAGGDIKDADGDGYYLRETSSNGKPELQIFFGDDDGGFDQLTLLGVSIQQLRQNVQTNPEHYDFFG